MAKRTTPDMTGKASEITDPILLYARIGYRTYLAWRDGDQSRPCCTRGSISQSCGASESWPKEATDAGGCAAERPCTRRATGPDLNDYEDRRVVVLAPATSAALREGRRSPTEEWLPQRRLHPVPADAGLAAARRSCYAGPRGRRNGPTPGSSRQGAADS
jgi:hypothetical protein